MRSITTFAAWISNVFLFFFCDLFVFGSSVKIPWRWHGCIRDEATQRPPRQLFHGSMRWPDARWPRILPIGLVASPTNKRRRGPCAECRARWPTNSGMRAPRQVWRRWCPPCTTVSPSRHARTVDRESSTTECATGTCPGGRRDETPTIVAFVCAYRGESATTVDISAEWEMKSSLPTKHGVGVGGVGGRGRNGSNGSNDREREERGGREE